MSSRSGIAIMLVLVVLLLVEGMTAGMLALATHTRAAAAAQLRGARAESIARFAIASAFQQWSATGFDTIQVGATAASGPGSGSTADASWFTTIERVQTSKYLVRTQARVGLRAGSSLARVLAVARTLDPGAILREFNAALTSGGQVVIAGASAITAEAMESTPDSLCAASTISLPAPIALMTWATPLITASAVISGAVMLDTLAATDTLALQAIDWRDAGTLSDRQDSGVVVPLATASAGTCDVASGVNWGNPQDPTSPCAAYYPFVYAPANLTMAGGYGQGILVVDGIFSMTSSASYRGLIIARDGINLEAGTTVNGAIASRRGYALLDGASLVYSGCALAEAIGESGAAHRLLPQPRRFLPAF